MQRTIFIFVVIWFLSISHVYPQSYINDTGSFAVGPNVSGLIGHTSYTLEAPGVKSYLEFPLNTILGGIDIGIMPTSTLLERWDLRLSAATNLNEPYGYMEDHDWYLNTGYPDIKFSYTESKATMTLYDIGVEVAREILRKNNLVLKLSLAYAYQYIHQEIDNYKGWQYQWDATIGDNGAFQLYLISASNTPALDYKIHYHRPTVGITSQWAYARLSFFIGVRGEGVYVKDKDDHILRNKTSTASGIGIGASGFAELKYFFVNNEQAFTPFISLKNTFSYLYAPIEATQEWYGDDPAIPQDTTGEKISGINHTIKSKQFNFSLSGGVKW